jgi:hypothetical protein
VSPKGAALLAMLAAVGVLLAHRQVRTLRNRYTLTGAGCLTAGLALLFVYWCEVDFVVLGAASTDACSSALGLTGDRAHLRTVVRVMQQHYPPKVTCGYGDHVVTLTSPATTSTWTAVWVIGWTFVALAVVLLVAGLVLTRGWRKRPTATSLRGR